MKQQERSNAGARAHEEAQAKQREHENDIRLGPLGKDGDKLLASLEAGNMVAVVSEDEIMYTFLVGGNYLCYLHKMDAEDGRCKSFPKDAAHRAMIKNLANLADHLFEAKFHKGMDRFGIMVAAERGIINLLDMTGQLPVEDVDFMAPYEAAAQDGDGSAEA